MLYEISGYFVLFEVRDVAVDVAAELSSAELVDSAGSKAGGDEVGAEDGSEDGLQGDAVLNHQYQASLHWTETAPQQLCGHQRGVKVLLFTSPDQHPQEEKEQQQRG